MGMERSVVLLAMSIFMNPKIGAEAGVNSDKSLASHSAHIPDARPVKMPDVETVWLALRYHVGVVMICAHRNVSTDVDALTVL